MQARDSRPRDFPEERFIIAALRDEQPSGSGIDSGRLIRLAHWHGVAPLVWNAVRSGPGVPDGILRALSREHRKVQRDNLLLLDRLVRLHDLMLSEQVEHLLLKGGALIPLAYESEAHRPMADIDLLIHARDWPRLSAALSATGRYDLPGGQTLRRRMGYFNKVDIPTKETPSSVFELHTGLEVSGRNLFSTDRCFSDSVELPFLDRTFRRLSDAMMTFHLVVHAARHFSRPRLIWMVDLRLLALNQAIDWERLASDAEQTGNKVAAYFALGYLEKVFPGTVPEACLRRLRPSSLRRRVLELWRTEDPLLPTRDIWAAHRRWFFALALLDGPLAMGNFAARHLYRRFLQGGSEH